MNTPANDMPPPIPPEPSDPAAAKPFGDGWRPLPPAARRVGTIVAMLMALPFTVGLAIASTALLRLGAVGSVAAALAVFAALATAFVAIARLRWRRTQWRLDARGLQVRRGVIWHSEVLVPRSRVQHLDLERGPIERRFGLATLVVHTAGTRLSALRQSGFADADAVALREALVPEAADDDL